MRVYDLLAERLADRLDCPVSDITPETTFESLGLDSLDLADVLIELESGLKMEIEADRKIATLQDLVDLIESIQSRTGGSKV
ncbi:MAG: phosphopantetheine-binding protein [Planctomycetia bacterium]|nr:phosphopantetheine-binding protein [Planctomycetia bacterium]